MPVGDRRSVRARFAQFGGTRFRGPLAPSMPVGDRRSSSRAFAQSAVHAVSTASAGGVPTGDRRSKPFARFCAVGVYAVSTASRRSMPVGDRRSVRALPRSSGVREFRPPLARSMPVRSTALRSALLRTLGVRAVSTASTGRSMPVGDRRSRAVRALLLSRRCAVPGPARHPVLRGHSCFGGHPAHHPPSIVRASVPIPKPR